MAFTPSTFKPESFQPEEPGIVQKAGGVLDKVADLFIGRTRDVGELAVGGIGISKKQALASKRSDEIFEESQDLIRQARVEKDPDRKKALLDQSRELDFSGSNISRELEEANQKLIERANISEEDFRRSNLEFAARRGGAASVEQFALLAPGAKEVQAFQRAAQAKNVYAKMAAAGLIGGSTAGSIAATDPQSASFEESIKKGGEAAIKGFVTAAAITGAIDIGKAGLKVAGRTLKSLIPKKNVGNQMWANSLNVPARVARRLKPIETADEIGAQYGISGSLDDLEQINRRVTGDTGILTKMNRSAIGSIKEEVDVTKALEGARQYLDIDGVTLNDGVRRRLLNAVGDTVSASPGKLPGKANALDAFSMMQKLEAKGWEAMNKSTIHNPNLDAEAIGGAYLAAADEIAMILNQSSVDENVLAAVKTPEVQQGLAEISPELAKRFMRARSISDLRSLQAPFVRLQKMIDITNDYQFSTFAKNLRAQTNPLTRAANLVMESPTVQTGLGKTIARAEAGPIPTALSGLASLVSGPAAAVTSAAERAVPTAVGFVEGRR